MSRGDRVEDLYSRRQFEDLLDDAEANARTEKEEQFVADMRMKFEDWGMAMFLSEAQDEWLNSLANR